MNQLLHSGGGSSNKQSNPLLGLAGQFLGGKQSSGHGSNAGLGGVVGGLASSFMNAGKQNAQHQAQQPQSYSGQAPQGGYGQQQQGGLMGSLGGKLGGMFGGHSTGGVCETIHPF